ncbi:hypothetical protein K7X08_022683 [Anisodus acutangulus]|uniref:eRF1 domain-containing protein n=1 Tax=Anisodus acutangulus TaxID=402998 RepID=A0A9Q1MLL6_9SOLA|nr:hypothetical protein K7X08_022683 [Anisodus acutangulus]
MKSGHQKQSESSIRAWSYRIRSTNGHDRDRRQERKGGNVKFMQEINIIGKYLEEISKDSGKYVVGLNDTLKVLETGAVETLIVWENLDVTRETIIKHLNKEQEADQSNCRDPATNAELEIKAKMPLLEWLSNEYKKFGCNLEFVTNKSQEGSQFCRGFGGIGAILRYKLEVPDFDDLSDDY